MNNLFDQIYCRNARDMDAIADILGKLDPELRITRDDEYLTLTIDIMKLRTERYLFLLIDEGLEWLSEVHVQHWAEATPEIISAIANWRWCHFMDCN